MIEVTSEGMKIPIEFVKINKGIKRELAGLSGFLHLLLGLDSIIDVMETRR